MIAFVKKNYFDFLAFIFVVSVSFSKAVPNIILGLLAASFIIISIKNKTKPQNPKHIKYVEFLFIYFLIISFFYGTFQDNFSFFSKFVLIILIPVILINVKHHRIVLSFLSFTFIAVVMALYKTIRYYLIFDELPFSDGIIVNKLLIIERPYMGFICLVSALLSLYLSSITKGYKKYLIALTVFFTFFIFIIVARLSLVTTFILAVIYVLFYLKTRLHFKLLLVAATVFFSVVATFSYKNISNRITISDEKGRFYDPRIDVWNCVMEIAKGPDFNNFVGLKSFNQVRNSLNDCYKSKNQNDFEKREWFVEKNFNTHNQFFDLFLATGIIGILIFIAALLNLFLFVKNNFYFTSILVSLILFLFFENIFHRQLGCYVTGIILLLFNGSGLNLTKMGKTDVNTNFLKMES